MTATVADRPRARLIEINTDHHVCNLVAAVTAPVRARQLCSAGNAISYRDFLALESAHAAELVSPNAIAAPHSLAMQAVWQPAY